MELGDLIQEYVGKGTASFYEFSYKLSTLFPYSNHVAHAGLIGAAPFLAGKYACKQLYGLFQADRNEKIEDIFGGLTALLAECAWLLFEQKSPYDHPNDLQGKLIGVGETVAGAAIAGIGGGLISRKNDSEK